MMDSEGSTTSRLEYASPSMTSRWPLVGGIIAVSICVLQYFWCGVVGWAAWVFLVGDNPATHGQVILIAAGLVAPVLLAAALGWLVRRRARSRLPRLLGLVGLIAGIGWCAIIVVWFIHAWAQDGFF